MSAQDIDRIAESLDNLYHYPQGLPWSEEHDGGRLALSRLEARLARLEEGLRRYGRHGTFCGWLTGNECDCGLDALLAENEEMDAALAAVEELLEAAKRLEMAVANWSGGYKIPEVNEARIAARRLQQLSLLGETA